MKLSVAIRLGAMIRPQGRHAYLRHGKSCAVGAALEAIGVPLKDLGNDMFERTSEHEAAEEFARRPEFKEWSQINAKANQVCPSCSKDQGSVTNAIVCLNNEHRWTRERIADWVESIESPALSPVAQGQEVGG